MRKRECVCVCVREREREEETNRRRRGERGRAGRTMQRRIFWSFMRNRHVRGYRFATFSPSPLPAPVMQPTELGFNGAPCRRYAASSLAIPSILHGIGKDTAFVAAATSFYGAYAKSSEYDADSEATTLQQRWWVQQLVKVATR